MKLNNILIILLVLMAGGVGTYFFLTNRKTTSNQSPISTPVVGEISPTPYPDTQHAIQVFLVNKYNKPLSDVHVTVEKEVAGYAAGSVLFGQGGPGEGGMWLAVLGSSWEVVWDGNGNVNCDLMRQEYGFPDSILRPNFCD